MGPGRVPLFFIAAGGHERTAPSRPTRRNRRESTNPGGSKRTGSRSGSRRIAGPVLRDLDLRLVRVKISSGAERDRADHGRAPRRHDVDRGLRAGEPDAVARSRCRRSDHGRLPAGGFVAGHRPAAGARIRFPPRDRPRGQNRDGGRRSAAASGSAASSRASRSRTRRRSSRSSSIDDKAEDETIARLSVKEMAEARLVLTDDLIRAALRREKAAHQASARPNARRRNERRTRSEG